MRTIEVSVGIPVRDRLTDLRMAVASVMSQTLRPRELVIVDDGSVVPVTAASLGPIGDGTSLRIVRHETSRGAVAAYNRLVQEASSPILAFLDSDDCFAPTYVEKVAGVWREADPEMLCVATGLFWCTNELRPYRTHLGPALVAKDHLIRDGNVVGGFSVLSVRRDCFLAEGGVPDCRGAFDWALMLKLTAIGRMVTIQEPLVFYRSPSTTALATETSKFRRQILGHFDIIRSLPPDERSRARAHVARIAAFNLAQADRRRLSWRCIRHIAARHGVDRNLVRTAAITVIGGRAYASLNRRFAYLRASLRAGFLRRRTA